jgi:hypothetical protein
MLRILFFGITVSRVYHQTVKIFIENFIKMKQSCLYPFAAKIPKAYNPLQLGKK